MPPVVRDLIDQENDPQDVFRAIGKTLTSDFAFTWSLIATQMDSKKISSTVSALDLILAISFKEQKCLLLHPLRTLLCLIYIFQRKYSMLLKEVFKNQRSLVSVTATNVLMAAVQKV